MFKTLKRLVYQVPDLAKAREWYNTILRTDPVYDTPFGVIYKIGDCSLSLLPADPRLPPDGGRISAYWEVDDVDAAYGKLLAAGAVPHAEPKNIASVRAAKVADPFGNTIGICGRTSRPTQRHREDPSETALNVALCRALAAKDPREKIRGPDRLAELFIPPEKRKPLDDQSIRPWVIDRLITPALYGYLIARTAYFDGVFERELRRGVPQFVFLGAGYDTRPYRFGDKAGNARIFELDSRPTQQRKREILAKAGVPFPRGLSFVSIDFSTDDIAKTLAQAGYDESLQTLFIWEGVTYYLSASDVEKVLKFAKSHSPAGSILCFDYLTEELESPNAGEPFQFWIGPDRIGAFLSERGFAVAEHLGPADIESRFLTVDGAPAENSLTRFRLISAVAE